MNTIKYFLKVMGVSAFIFFLLAVGVSSAHQHYWQPKCDEDCITPTQAITPTLDPCNDTQCVTPEATPTAEVTQVPQNNAGQGDGLNDGQGCGQHDCNTHKNDPPPATSPYDGTPVGWK